MKDAPIPSTTTQQKEMHRNTYAFFSAYAFFFLIVYEITYRSSHMSRDRCTFLKVGLPEMAKQLCWLNYI